jgi:4-amino-4-deoxy-L-arabinose transferase-like glycosyltransferase
VTDGDEDSGVSGGEDPFAGVAPRVGIDQGVKPLAGGPSDPEGVPWSRRLQVWRSPPDQPAWARPTLLVVAALAALAYTWHIGSEIEIFYAAAVRSMSQNWHDFVFGAFDPAGTITVDKLPGAMWVQALSVRLFGFHVRAIMLPSAVEGVLTVLVLYHAVRRLAGPVAGLVAAVVLVASPATTTLDRGNIPDSLMILLVVLAVDSMVTAVLDNRWRSVILAGVWVSLAFQAKMLEAWLVLPALGLAYLLAARGRPVARLGRLAVLGATTAVVSLSYMIFVALTPASQRPYEDGSTTNSVFHMVFVYNGFSRLGQASPNQLLGRTLGSPLFSQAEPPPAWNRLLTDNYGHDTGWLIPATLMVGVALLLLRRGEPRSDRWRAGAVLWGSWLVVLGVVFTVSTTMNSYYAGALSPAVAALLGFGGAYAWAHRHRPVVLLGAAAIVLVTIGYAAWLLPPGGTGLPHWLATTVVVVGLLAVVVLVWTAWRGDATSQRSGAAAVAPLGWALAAAAVLLVPAAASGSVVAEALGPFDTPFQPPIVTRVLHQVFAPQANPPGLAQIRAVQRGAPYLMAAQTSAVASVFIYATGQEVVPLGGYTGTVPAPSVATVQSLLARGDFHLALIASPAATPATAYIVAHCIHVAQPGGRPASGVAPKLRIFYCVR